MAEPLFSARAPWRTPRFQPIRKAEQPCRPSPRASSRFPSVPPLPSLKTCALGSVSFHTLGLSPFSRPWPNRCFRPARHGEPLVFSPDARPNSHAARRRATPCRFPSVSAQTYTLASVSFYTLGLSLFPRPCPNRCFRPVRHGEPLVFSPDARPNGPTARRRVPPCRFPSVPPCPSPKTYTLASVSFYTLGLSLFPRPWPNRCFRPARHGERLVFSPDARPNSTAAPSPSCPSPKAYVAASVSFHTLGLGFFFGRARTHGGLRPLPTLRLGRFRSEDRCPSPVGSKPSR